MYDNRNQIYYKTIKIYEILSYLLAGGCPVGYCDELTQEQH